MREWHATLPCPLDRPVRECEGHPLNQTPTVHNGVQYWSCRDGQSRPLEPGEAPKIVPQSWGFSPMPDQFHCPICGRELQTNFTRTCDRPDCAQWAKRERDRATTEVPRGSIRCSTCGEIETMAAFGWHRCIEKIEEGAPVTRFQ